MFQANVQRLAGFFCVVVLTTGVASSVAQRASGAVVARSAAGTITIPATMSGSTVLLPVSVNGSSRRWFVVDSGATMCLLSKALATELRIPTRTTSCAAGTGSVSRVDASTVVFGIDGGTFSVDHVGVTDLSAKTAVLGHPVDGVLGADFFQQFVVEMNYSAQVVRLHDPQTYKYPGGGEIVPLTFDRQLPYLSASLFVQGLKPQTRSLLVATGSEDAVNDNAILESAGPRRDPFGVGVVAEPGVTFARSERVEIGNLEFADVPGAAPGESLVGGEILRRFTAVFDFQRSRLILEPNRHYRESFPDWDQSGLDLRLVPETGAVIVHKVQSANAGLLAGDVITTIDGVLTSEYGLRRVQRMFGPSPATFRLTVRRGDADVEVVLRLGGC